jgi:NADH-quinone oxidoreductase subunit J
MTGSLLLFFILAGLSIAFSLAVVFQRNPIHSAMALVVTLFLVAILFLTLDAPMVGVLQILVYAGAIMVLFLFVIMLLNPQALERRQVAWWSLGSIAALLLVFELAALLIGAAAPGEPVAAVGEGFGSPEMLGRSLFRDFVLPFEIASVLLLVAIVGAVVLAKRGE